MDEYGTTSSAPSGISFAWPNNVSVDDHYVYVADTLNDRIIRGKIEYIKTAEIPVQIYGKK